MNVNSARDFLTGRHRVSGPPYISTWDWPAARKSVAALARLKPEVLACGHGRPMTGPQAAASLASFSGRFSRQPAPGHSRNGRAARAASAPEPGGPARKLARISWKATEEEQAMPLPGDDLVPSPVVQTTHAVTINGCGLRCAWPGGRRRTLARYPARAGKRGPGWRLGQSIPYRDRILSRRSARHGPAGMG